MLGRLIAAILAVLVIGLANANAEIVVLKKDIHKTHPELGRYVSKLRTYLNLGNGPSFGPKTEAAVKALQTKYGVSPTGEVYFNTENGKIFLDTKPSKQQPLSAPTRAVASTKGGNGLTEEQKHRLDLGLHMLRLSYEEWQKRGSIFGERKGPPNEKKIVKIEKEAGSSACQSSKMTYSGKQVLLDVRNTKASKFGHKDKGDSGRGSPLLNPAGPSKGLYTGGKNCRAVAIPFEDVVRIWNIKPKYYKDGVAHYDWDDFREARMCGVRFWSSVTKSWHGFYPLADFGPGKGCQNNNVKLDLCNGANTDAQGDGMTPVSYQLVANVFPERAGIPAKL